MALFAPILNDFSQAYDVTNENFVINFSCLVDDKGVVVSSFDKINIVIEEKNEDNTLSELYNSSVNVDTTMLQKNNTVSIADYDKTKFSNGKQYYVRIRASSTKEGVTTYSEFSARKILKCCKTAVAQITSPVAVEGGTCITTTYVDVYGKYIKEDTTDNIDLFYCELYKQNTDGSYFLLSQSEKIRTSNTENLLRRFIDLDDDSVYKLIFYCISKSKRLSTSDSLVFTTRFKQVEGNINNLEEVKYISGDDHIELKGYFVQYIADSEGNVKYTDQQELDATDGDVHIIYRKSGVEGEGIRNVGLDTLKDKYAIQLWIRKPKELEKIMCIGINDTETKSATINGQTVTYEKPILEESYVKYYDRHFHFFVNSCGVSSHYMSEEIFESTYTLQDTDILYLYIKYCNNYEHISMQVGIEKLPHKGGYLC